MQLRTNKKEAKKSYNHALKHDRQKITETLKEYLQAQQQLKNELQEYDKECTKQRLQKMITQGKLNAGNFWKIKSDTEKNKEPEPYDTITENNTARAQSAVHIRLHLGPKILCLEFN